MIILVARQIVVPSAQPMQIVPKTKPVLIKNVVIHAPVYVA